jgi:hypothetical protein
LPEVLVVQIPVGKLKVGGVVHPIHLPSLLLGSPYAIL